MIAVFKTIIEILTEIRTPLIFWSFMLFVFLLGFYIFTKNNTWYIKTTLPVIHKLSKASLYKLTRLIFISIFIFFILLIIVAFFAPLLDKLIDKKYDKDVITTVVDSKNEVVENINVNRNYQKIIELYEKGDIEYSRLLIEEVFKKKIIKQDDYNGYVVASYFGNGDYKKAAIKVLERDKLKPKWDCSLRNDLAQCIRSYSLKYGRLSGLELVEELKLKYGEKLISVFWTLIPIDILRAINLGYYSIYTNCCEIDNDKEELLELIRLYPKDRYLDFAYFVLGDYELAIKSNPNSKIKDLCLYGIGYTAISKFRTRYSQDINSYDNYFMQKLFNKNQLVESNNFERAITSFKKYIELSPKLPQSDDACYWLGWIYAQRRDFTEAMNYLALAQRFGNLDYAINSITMQYYLLQFFSLQEKKYYLKNIESSKITSSKAQRIDYIVNKLDPLEAIFIVLSDSSLSCLSRNKVINMIVDNQLKYYGNLTNCIKIYNSYHNIISNHLLSEVYNISIVDKVDHDLLLRLIKIKSNSACRRLSDQMIDKVLLRTRDCNIIPYLLYIKISIAKIEYPQKTEALVHDFLIKYKNHPLADDVLGELIYVHSFVYNDFVKAEKDYKYLINNYPNGNALDNSLYWLALGYDNSTKDETKKIAKKLYLQIIKQYPYTRFARYAARNLNNINQDNY